MTINKQKAQKCITIKLNPYLFLFDLFILGAETFICLTRTI